MAAVPIIEATYLPQVASIRAIKGNGSDTGKQDGNGLTSQTSEQLHGALMHPAHPSGKTH